MSAHLVWALLLAMSLLANCATHARLESAQTTINTYKRDLQAQKDQAAETLATETAKKQAAEKALAEFKNQQESTDATSKQTIQRLEGRLARLGGPDRRLRDPNGNAGCGPGGGGTPGEAAAPDADRAGDGAEAGGLLSVQLSDLLRERLREADAINAAYASCRGIAVNDRAAQAPP